MQNKGSRRDLSFYNHHSAVEIIISIEFNLLISIFSYLANLHLNLIEYRPIYVKAHIYPKQFHLQNNFGLFLNISAHIEPLHQKTESFAFCEKAAHFGVAYFLCH